MENQLHPAALVEEAFGDDGVNGREGTQRGVAFADVLGRLFGAAAIQTTFGRQPRHSLLAAGRDFLAEFRYFLRELDGATRRFAAPEGDPGRRAVRILHTHSSG